MARTPQAWEIPNWRMGGELIDSRAICQRLEDMDNEHGVADEGDVIPVSSWPRGARAEHAALTDLLEDIKANIGGGWDISARGDAITLVRHTHLVEYVESWYEDTYAGELTQFDPNTYRHERISWHDLISREPLCWIDWKVAARAWRQRCPEVIYHGVTYVMDH